MCSRVNPSNAFGSEGNTRSVFLDLNISRIFQAAPVEAGELEEATNERMNRIPVLDMEETKSLTEYLGFVVCLNPKSLSGMKPAQALFKTAYYRGFCSFQGQSFQRRCALYISTRPRDEGPRHLRPLSQVASRMPVG
jgi:hypothetical protein